MLNDPYHWVRAFHIVAVISWMAGMFYLPRLFVYHSRAAVGSEASETFKLMESRLLRMIVTPAMIWVWALGLWLVMHTNAMDPANGKWMHWKLLLVIIMSGMHGMMASYVKKFARDERPKSERYFRIFNEVPVVIMILIVILVVVRPV